MEMKLGNDLECDGVEAEGSDQEEAQGPFSLQFERVVPDSAYALDVLPEPEVHEELEVMADRWWSRFRRRFFRHNYWAYAVVEGQWQRVTDPKGPRYKPRKRHRKRAEKREERLRREMRSE